ncbi:MAG: serine/threonine protein kinase [Candidatus Coatesbacteria bacterium]|nr:serine/threonine protein kinase [Candidatus Coatesbacteria bacterium]
MNCINCGNYLPENVKECPFCAVLKQKENDIDYFLSQKKIFAERYVLISLLGKSSWTRVFTAEDISSKSLVALRILKTSDFLDQDFSSYYMKEAYKASRMLHNNIVKIFKIGRYNGYVYIAEELLASDVKKTLIDEDLQIEKKLKIAYQVSLGLSFAHHKGILHLDLHPGNVLLDEEKSAKISGFCVVKAGWGKAVSGKGSPNPPPSYLAPELIRNGIPTHLTDIYSYGVMFYFMMTGKMPYKEPDFMLSQRKMLSPVSPQDINKNIPDEINRLLLKCLSPKPIERPQSIDEVTVILNSIVNKSSLVVSINNDSYKILNHDLQVSNSYSHESLKPLKEKNPMQTPPLKPILNHMKKKKRFPVKLSELGLSKSFMRSFLVASVVLLFLLSVNFLRNLAWDINPFDERYPEIVISTLPKKFKETKIKKEVNPERKEARNDFLDFEKKLPKSLSAEKKDESPLSLYEKKEVVIKPTSDEAFEENLFALNNEIEKPQPDNEKIEKLEAVSKFIVKEWSVSITDGDIDKFVSLFSDPTEYLSFNKISREKLNVIVTNWRSKREVKKFTAENIQAKVLSSSPPYQVEVSCFHKCYTTGRGNGEWTKHFLIKWIDNKPLIIKHW